MRFHFQIEGELNAEEADLPSMSAAKCHALRYASMVVCDEPQKFWESGGFQMTVSDETGLTLFALVMSGIEAPSIQMTQRVPT